MKVCNRCGDETDGRDGENLCRPDRSTRLSRARAGAEGIMIARAILYLANRCDGARTEDGAGYSKYDAPWGRDAARKIEAGDGGAVNLVYAVKVLTKYRRQLAAGGIELPTLESCQLAQAEATTARKPAAPNGVEVSRVGESLRIRFPYPKKVEIARGLPNRRWDPNAKAWVCPVAALDAVLAAFPGARLADGLAEEMEAKRRAEEAAEHARQAQVAADLSVYAQIVAEIAERRTLYAHQAVGCEWLIEHRHAILADDMGLGKTLQALVAARALGHKIIVVAPAGLRINWLREAEAVGAQIEIFSWAKVPDPPDCDFVLIADEAHYAQSLKAQRTKRFLALAKAARAVYCLTGTPIKNGRPANLFPLLVATRHPLAADKRGYEVRYCAARATRWTQWDVTGAAHLDELHREIADGVLRRMKEECLDLPEKTRVLRKAELTDTAQQLYTTRLHEMQTEYRRKKAAGEIGEADALVLMNHLRHAGSLAKVEAATELAEEVIEQGGQVVLFTAFCESAEQIAQALGAEQIAGDVDAAARQAAIDRFQAGERKAIVCTLGAGNVGITLTAAQTVVLVDRPWTPGDAVQAEDRLHRIGQRSAVTAVWLQANGADEAIDALLEQKHERIELVLAGKRKSLRGIRSIGDVAEAVLG